MPIVEEHYFYIECDGCERIYPPRIFDPVQLVEFARRDGWIAETRGAELYALCPDCQKEEEK